VILFDNNASTNLNADDDAKPIAANYLNKWRPRFIEQHSDRIKIEESKVSSASATQNGNLVVT
jgi:hypothetical protein